MRSPYRVAPNGQSSLSTSARRAWECFDGGSILTADLDEAVFIARHDIGYDLIEALYPQSKLTERGFEQNAHTGSKNGSRIELNDYQDLKSLIDFPLTPFKAQRVGPSGQFTIDRRIRRRWGMAEGGKINLIELGSAVVIKPISNSTPVRELVPVELIAGREWERHDADFLAAQKTGYASWCADLGEKMIRFSMGGEAAMEQLTPSSHTKNLLAKTIGLTVVRHSFLTALKKAEASPIMDMV